MRGLLQLQPGIISWWSCTFLKYVSEIVKEQVNSWSDQIKFLQLTIVQNSFWLLHIPRGRNSPSKKMVHYPRNLDLMLSFHNGEKQRVSFISDAKRQLHQTLLSKKIFQQRNFFEQGENTCKISSEACSPAETNAI